MKSQLAYQYISKFIRRYLS